MSGLALSTEQVELGRSVRALLAKRSDSAALRKAIAVDPGYDVALWAVLCEQIGVAALPVPESYGGAGAGWAETCVAMSELGRMLTPGPLLGTGVLAAALLLEAGDDAGRARLLPGIAAGTTVAGVAWAGADGVWARDAGSAALHAHSGTVNGSAHYVLDGAAADLLLAVARDEHGLGLYEVKADGAVVTGTPAMDPTRRLAVVELMAAPARRLGDLTGSAGRVLDIAIVALSAEQVGAADRILELTVEYAKTRVQFGRPIGSFQALKHRMADLHVLVEAARSASMAAAAGLLAPSVAKAYCSEAFTAVAGECIQLHGGIAITWEHDAHLYFKRAHGSAQLFGSPDAHLRALGPHLGPEQV